MFGIETLSPGNLGPRLPETMLSNSLVFIREICPESGGNEEGSEEEKDEKWDLWANMSKGEAA